MDAHLNAQIPPVMGEIIQKDKPIMRVAVGAARSPDADGCSYELCTSLGVSPLITSHKTGKHWRISWGDLIGLAIAAGIDEEVR